MTAPDAIHFADIVGDWACISWQGRALPAEVGGSLMVGGELTLRWDGSFSLMRLEVAPGEENEQGASGRPISCVHAYEGSYGVEPRAWPDGRATTRLRLHVASHVQTTLRPDHSETAAVSEAREFEVAADSTSELTLRLKGAEESAVSRFTR